MTLLLIANFCFIALKAFQQKNVMKDRYKEMFFTSLAMGAMEVFVIANVALIWIDAESVIVKLFLALLVGASGGLGSIVGCIAFKRSE